MPTMSGREIWDFFYERNFIYVHIGLADRRRVERACDLPTDGIPSYQINKIVKLMKLTLIDLLFQYNHDHFMNNTLKEKVSRTRGAWMINGCLDVLYDKGLWIENEVGNFSQPTCLSELSRGIHGNTVLMKEWVQAQFNQCIIDPALVPIPVKQKNRDQIFKFMWTQNTNWWRGVEVKPLCTTVLGLFKIDQTILEYHKNAPAFRLPITEDNRHNVKSALVYVSTANCVFIPMVWNAENTSWESRSLVQ